MLNLVVKPKKPVMSYLTPLTGLTKKIIDEHGISFEDAMDAGVCVCVREYVCV